MKATTRLLAAQGFTDIKPGGYTLFGCGEDDIFRTRFSARSQDGYIVKGQVCRGLFKGSTVRFD